MKRLLINKRLNLLICYSDCCGLMSYLLLTIRETCSVILFLGGGRTVGGMDLPGIL